MEPNYSEYSESELREALATIDKATFPERVKKLEAELMERKESDSTVQSSGYEVIDASEKFYRCPTCEKKISIFSKTINKWGKIKTCPYCDAPFTSGVSLKYFFIMAVPAFLLNFFLLFPVLKSFELSTSIGTAVTCGILVMLSMRLKKVRMNNVT